MLGHLREATRSWLELDRDPGGALSGCARLQVVLDVVGARGDAVPASRREFIDASGDARDRESKEAADASHDRRVPTAAFGSSSSQSRPRSSSP